MNYACFSKHSPESLHRTSPHNFFLESFPIFHFFPGFRTTKGSRLLGTRFEEQRLTLRIHRGTSRSAQHHHHHHHHCPSSPKPMISSPSNGRQQQQQQQQQQLHNNGGTPGGNNGNGNAGGGGSASSSSALSRIPRSRSHERLKVHLTPPPRGKCVGRFSGAAEARGGQGEHRKDYVFPILISVSPNVFVPTSTSVATAYAFRKSFKLFFCFYT